jgi:hypothetical protein
LIKPFGITHRDVNFLEIHSRFYRSPKIMKLGLKFIIFFSSWQVASHFLFMDVTGFKSFLPLSGELRLNCLQEFACHESQLPSASLKYIADLY